jgi:hypothetical protein
MREYRLRQAQLRTHASFARGGAARTKGLVGASQIKEKTGRAIPLAGSRAPRELAVRRPSRTAAGRCGGRHWKVVSNGRRQRHLPRPSKPLDRAQARRTTALTMCLQLDVCAQIDERNASASAAASAATVAQAAATSAVVRASYWRSLYFLHGPKARADPFGLRRMPPQAQVAQQSA